MKIGSMCGWVIGTLVCVCCFMGGTGQQKPLVSIVGQHLKLQFGSSFDGVS